MLPRPRTLTFLLALAACTPEGAPEVGSPEAARPAGALPGSRTDLEPALASGPGGTRVAGAIDRPIEAPETPASAADVAVQQAAANIFAAVGTEDLRAIATAPADLARLGPAALPSITHELAHGGLPQRRVAALTLLQLGTAAAPAVAALRAAAGDPDPHVRAAAEHALRIATGDTSDLDRQRAQHEAAERRNQ